VPSTTTPTRRAQRREATFAEIHEAARTFLAQSGPDAVTLRGIATRLGMAPAGVHYYYPSRDELLTALIVEAFDELAAHTVAAGARTHQAAKAAHAWTETALAYRTWAIAHPALFDLAHSATATRLKDRPGLLDAKDRAVRALTDPLAATIASGQIELPVGPPVPRQLQRHLRRWADAAGVPRDPQLLLFLVQAYTLIHGAVVLTVTGSLPRELLEDDLLFRAQVARVLPYTG
jgi:AcrR family transcriptional regulator